MQPLKNKTKAFDIFGMCYHEDDVKSAVEWLKQTIPQIMLLSDLEKKKLMHQIDIAFEDAMKEEVLK